ncbi:Gldg family protein [Alteromonas sp. C1M14]|uniref:Gldg family protein n=1 Tax=Alteromonas sp. C1M14 TaxID=2841567 RepID=UPI001C09CCC6|nr:Gldg family protein [Alteromonas sp. C1M14]MBU2979134.1 Gldg family protein [Alteromonas sp. C1M14]
MSNYSSILMQIIRKEFRGFFSTPAAYLFLGGFLAATLFVFFWVETFFARNIADVRPLFQWLPLLLIFLIAALTMRAWSEERRAGTLESLLTSPVSPLQLIVGKFAATLSLVVLALFLTLPLPFTVSLLGPLDWGPVIGGYVATLFLAAAYIAIGLYMSGRTDNPVVALILTVIVCGLFYFIGSPTLTDLFGGHISKVLALMGTGSRFESITRGVLDIRDVYYYLSIMGVFLTLNLFSLERLRWAGNPISKSHRYYQWAVALTIANFVIANCWLNTIPWARVDITENQQYSLSDATDSQLASLQEPLQIRGYFSAKTHPLLAPLVPQLEDLLKEYAIKSDGRVNVEFIDPTQDQDAEEEAASRFGIKPVPFQTADRYQSAVVSSYFDLVISYGDQFETLGFQDLIEVKSETGQDLDVLLKNPEYAITRAIRKVAGSFQAAGDPFDTIDHKVVFKGYMSPSEQLPESLQNLRSDLQSLLDDWKKQAGDKFAVQFADPEANNGTLAEALTQKFGFSPQVASLLDPKPFWFYMVLESDGETVQVPLPETLDKNALKRALDSALHRLTPGVLKTVSVVKPAAYGPNAQGYTALEKVLKENVRVKDEDLADGQVAEDSDLLLVLSPQALTDTQRFAVDQFLMQGGSVVLMTSPYNVQVNQSLTASKQTSGLSDWLAHYGVEIDDSLVLDPQNTALPVPVQRYIGGLPIQEIRMLPYPHFPDLRGDSLNQDNPITASLGQLTLNWASPIHIDKEKNKDRQVAPLLYSSKNSWTSDNLDLIPNYEQYPDTGFPPADEHHAYLLGVAIEGQFTSFYEGKPSPLLNTANTGNTGNTDENSGDEAQASAADDTNTSIGSVITRSPSSARLTVVSSNTFASDATINLISQGLNTLYTKPVDFVQNTIDWSLEDRGLLALRGQTQLARTLIPMTPGEQRWWEWTNYGLAVIALLAIWIWRRGVAASDARKYKAILAEVK